MRMLIAFAAIGCLAAATSGSAFADTCSAQAGAKKLHGAAETSFTAKCVRDATGA